MLIWCLLSLYLVHGLAQEFWVGNEELVNIYEKRLGDAGYVNFQLARTNNRGDGTVFFIVNIKKNLFFNWGY